MKTVNAFVGKYMSLIILAVSALALFVPNTCLWIDTSWINYLLMAVMFCMGITLKPSDFTVVFKHPSYIIIGCLAQFTIMPLLAFGLGKIFSLEAGLLTGVILVGTCPGGTASNVITYLSKGDVALSVGMTAVNTLLAPLLTPAITYVFLRSTIEVDVSSLFLSIVIVVVVPIILGFVINRFLGQYTSRVSDTLPVISVAAIALIIASVVSNNAQKIMETGALVFAVVVLHNVLGYAAGFLLGTVLKLPLAEKKALSVEIGMQNAGLATSLAGTAFPDLALATVPGAIFSIWHNFSGAILANIFRRLKDDGALN